MIVKVWVAGPNALKVYLTEPEVSITSLHFTESDMSEYGWIQVGTAIINITPDSKHKLVDRALTAIDAALGKAHTDAAELKQTLLAISYTPEA